MLSTSPRRNELVWLAAVLLLAAAMRLAGLNAPLWYDEILTLQSHVSLPWDEMMRSYSMNHHYLFSFAAKGSVTLFGDSTWAVRLPAMLFGLGSIAVCWMIARDVDGPVTAALVALLLALSYHHIWFSQNARGYTGLAFWAALGMLLFLRGVSAPRAGIWLSYGVVAALAVFTHLTAVFFFLVHGLVWAFIVVWRTGNGSLTRGFLGWPLAGFILAAVLSGIAYAPILPSLLETVSSVSDSSAVDVMQEYQNPLWTITEALRTMLGTVGPVAGAAAACGVALCVLGGIRTRWPGVILGSVVLLHVGLTMSFLVAIGMRVWPRFFFLDIGFFVLLLVSGIAAICALAGQFLGRTAQAIALSVLVLGSAGLALRNYTAPKQDLHGAHQFVETIRAPNERVFVTGHAGSVFRDHFGADWEILFEADEYEQAMSEAGPALIVVPFPQRNFRRIPALDQDAETVLTLLRRFPGTLGDGAVLVYRRD